MLRMPYFEGVIGFSSRFIFGDRHLPLKLAGELLQNRPDHFARAAPLRPEIDQHRAGGLQHIGIKLASVTGLVAADMVIFH